MFVGVGRGGAGAGGALGSPPPKVCPRYLSAPPPKLIHPPITFLVQVHAANVYTNCSVTTPGMVKISVTLHHFHYIFNDFTGTACPKTPLAGFPTCPACPCSACLAFPHVRRAAYRRSPLSATFAPPHVNISAMPLMFIWSIPLIQFNIRASCLPMMCILSNHGLGQNLHSAVKLQVNYQIWGSDKSFQTELPRVD